MGSDLTLQAMDGADAEANLASHLADADALGQLQAGALDLVGFGTVAAELPAYLARLADEFSVADNPSLMTLSPAKTVVSQSI
jgi:hypothetical protein